MKILNEYWRNTMIAVAKKLTSKKRKSLPPASFVFPKERRYPIHDESHARNALARSSGTKDEAKVRAAVKKKFPGIEMKDKKKKSEALDLMIKTADILDELGMHHQADLLDSVMKYVSAADAPKAPTSAAGAQPPPAAPQSSQATTSKKKCTQCNQDKDVGEFGVGSSKCNGCVQQQQQAQPPAQPPAQTATAPPGAIASWNLKTR